MEYLGVIAFVFSMFLFGYIGKFTKLERKVKQLEKNNKGEDSMSDIIARMVGKRCKLEFDHDYTSVNLYGKVCTIHEVDDEWIKFSYFDKKSGTKIFVIKTEALCSVEIVEN
jgi:hypothetical protein